MTEAEQDQEQSLPEWNVSTHGPLPARLKDAYREVGVSAHAMPDPLLAGDPQGATPDGENAGDRVVEGPTAAGDGGADQQPSTGLAEGTGAAASGDKPSEGSQAEARDSDGGTGAGPAASKPAAGTAKHSDKSS